MTTDANTQQLTDGVAQTDADSQPTEAAPEATPAAPVAPATVATPAAPSYSAPAPAYTAPAQTPTPAYTAPAPTVTQPQFAVPPQGQYSVPPQGQYAVPPQAQYATPAGQGATPAQGKNAYGFAIASFVIGIASILSAWTFVAPIVGLVLGIIALRRNTSERTFALWGVWLNGAMLAFAAIGLVLFIGLASFGIFTGAATYGF